MLDSRFTTAISFEDKLVLMNHYHSPLPMFDFQNQIFDRRDSSLKNLLKRKKPTSGLKLAEKTYTQNAGKDFKE